MPKRINDSYEDGTPVTLQALMAKAAVKYETRLAAGTWRAPTADQEEIIALKSQVSTMEVVMEAPKSGARQSPDQAESAGQPRDTTSLRSCGDKEWWHIRWNSRFSIKTCMPRRIDFLNWAIAFAYKST